MNVTFRNATPRDLALLLGMIQQLYASDAIPFNEAKSRRAILVLLSEPEHGNVRVMEVDQQPVGYVVVTFAFSLEFGGRYGFIDELFVAEPYRGCGVGTAAVRHAASACADQGMLALLLEADLKNEHATRLYRRLGFREHLRRLMRLPLSANPQTE